MKTLARPRLSRARQPLLWGLCLSALAPPGAKAAGCMSMRGGEMVISASEDCLAQMQRDPTTRQQVARRISAQVGSGVIVAPAPAPAPSATPGEPRSKARGGRQGLDHPLARLSMLNAQSRYLWSLGNPAPVYYGQTQAR